MSVLRDLPRSMLRLSYPALAGYYRWRSGRGCPSPLLKCLRIADPSYRTDFYTLARVLREMAPLGGGLIAECGVYRGSTLLGMAHMLKSMGMSGWRLAGFDSFEGFPEPTQEDSLATALSTSVQSRAFSLTRASKN